MTQSRIIKPFDELARTGKEVMEQLGLCSGELRDMMEVAYSSALWLMSAACADDLQDHREDVVGLTSFLDKVRELIIHIDPLGNA